MSVVWTTARPRYHRGDWRSAVPLRGLRHDVLHPRAGGAPAGTTAAPWTIIGAVALDL